MTREEAEERFVHAYQTNDSQTVREVLRQHPGVLWDRPKPNYFLISAARSGHTELVEILLDMGVPINHKEPLHLKHDRPIESAAALQRSETVRFLVRRGAAINDVADDGSPRCYALYSAIRHDLDLARFLIAHGANINAVNERGTSVLSFALKMRPEFADELRALGAKETHELPGYVPPPIKHPIVRVVEERLCETHPLSWLALVPDEVPVAIHTAFHLDHYCLFTSGMSERAMTVPPGGEAYRFAELVLYLDGWDTDVDEWQTPEHLWVINWVRRLVQISFENDT